MAVVSAYLTHLLLVSLDTPESSDVITIQEALGILF
jgi:hypothetical protein